jgi:uncharacterized membrane protein YfcA
VILDTSTIYLLASLFFIVALAYSTVGLGGGSSYTALMTLAGMGILVIPTLSLVMNLVVTTIASFHFIINKHARFKLILPFVITSIPMAYLGGYLQLSREVFYWLLLISLIIVALRIYFFSRSHLVLKLNQAQQLFFSLLCGAVLGLVSGIVGLGGGIYLVPLIILFGLGSEKEAAASGAVFIWLNSLSGLLARVQYNTVDMSSYMPLILAVAIGGYMGSYLGAGKLQPKRMEQILGVLVLISIAFLSRKILLF